MIKFFIILLVLFSVIVIIHFALRFIYIPSNSNLIDKTVLETTVNFLSNLQHIKERFGGNIDFVKQQLSVTYVKKIPREAECEVLVRSDSKKLVIRVFLLFDEDKKTWNISNHEDATSEYTTK